MIYKSKNLTKTVENGRVLYLNSNYYKRLDISHPTLYIKRNIINSFGGFDTKLKISADYIFGIKMFFNQI